MVGAEGGCVIRDNGGPQAKAALDEMMVHSAHSQQSRDRRGLRGDAAAVAQH